MIKVQQSLNRIYTVQRVLLLQDLSGVPTTTQPSTVAEWWDVGTET